MDIDLPDDIVGYEDEYPIINGKQQDFEENSPYIGHGVEKIYWDEPFSPVWPYFSLSFRILKKQRIDNKLHIKLFPGYLLPKNVLTDDVFYSLSVKNSSTELKETYCVINDFGSDKYKYSLFENKDDLATSLIKFPLYLDFYFSKDLLIPEVNIYTNPKTRYYIYFFLDIHYRNTDEVESIGTLQINYDLGENNLVVFSKTTY